MLQYLVSIGHLLPNRGFIIQMNETTFYFDDNDMRRFFHGNSDHKFHQQGWPIEI